VQLPPLRGAANEPILLQVEIEYAAHNPLRALPIIGAMPRYLVAARNVIQKDPITLDPYVTRSRFPLIGIAGQAPELHWATFGLLPGASLEVKSIRVFVVPLAPQNRPWLEALINEQTKVMGQ